MKCVEEGLPVGITVTVNGMLLVGVGGKVEEFELSALALMDSVSSEAIVVKLLKSCRRGSLS
jgi:hypothetical protein